MQTVLLPDPQDNPTMLSDYFSAAFSSFPIFQQPIQELLPATDDKTLYKISNTFGFHYVYLRLSRRGKAQLLFIGPYVNEALTTEKILEYAEQNKITQATKKLAYLYSSAIPILPQNSPLFVLLNTFCERMWKEEYTVKDIESIQNDLPTLPIVENNDGNLDDALLQAKLLEERYRFENEMMRIVSEGQLQGIDTLFSTLSENIFENRISNSLQNSKNYCIIANTLMRKAAENGGVHPVYLDRLSSSFAAKIEELPSVSKSLEILYEMAHSYCRLVRKHSHKGYCPIVKKTAVLIESDLAADLTLSSLAKAQNVTAGYLSAVFHKETGKTVTDFIRDRRIRYAKHLLTSTSLQVQSVALHCGMTDVQYFSKLFKRKTGKTPKEYRIEKNAKEQKAP